MLQTSDAPSDIEIKLPPVSHNTYIHSHVMFEVERSYVATGLTGKDVHVRLLYMQDELKKLYDDKLESNMSGSLHMLIARTFRDISGKKVRCLSTHV